MRPAVDLDFARSGIIDPRVIISRASGATRRGPDGVWREVGVNTGRLHWDAAGVSLGLLMEPPRTNSVANARVEGAVAGTPGTLPTGWISGLANQAEVVGTGTTNGVPWVAPRYSPSEAGEVRVQFNPTVPNAANKLFACSFFAGFVGTAPPEITFTGFRMPNTVAPIVISSPFPNSGFTRHTVLFTGASDTASAYQLRAAWSAACTFTLRVGWPQLEEAAAFASTPILPPVGTPGASTRAAETMITLLSRYGLTVPLRECGMLFAGRAPAGLEVGGGAQRMMALTDGTADNVIALDRLNNRTVRATVTVGGVEQGTATTTATVADSADFLVGVGASAGGMSLSLNGAAVVTGTPALFPAVDRLAGGNWGGTCARVAVWPLRPSDSFLRVITI